MGDATSCPLCHDQVKPGHYYSLCGLISQEEDD